MKKVFLCVSTLLLLVSTVWGQQYYRLDLTVNDGGVYVTPPGQIVRREGGFFLFSPGTEVALEIKGTAHPLEYCAASTFSWEWTGDWTDDPSAASGKIVLDSDKSIDAYVEMMPPPCHLPLVSINISPKYTTLRTGKTFISSPIITPNTGGLTIDTYELNLIYDPSVIEPDSNTGINGVTGAYIAIIPNPGELLIGGPGNAALAVHWITLAEGTSMIQLSGTVNETSGVPQTAIAMNGGLVLVSSLPGVGDVNWDNSVNIADALIVARFGVGLLAAPFNGVQADVNRDGNVNIIDALQIAQFYVGLIELQGIY